jgi:hypothetical protein
MNTPSLTVGLPPRWIVRIIVGFELNWGIFKLYGDISSENRFSIYYLPFTIYQKGSRY